MMFNSAEHRIVSSIDSCRRTARHNHPVYDYYYSRHAPIVISTGRLRVEAIEDGKTTILQLDKNGNLWEGQRQIGYAVLEEGLPIFYL